MGKLSNIGKDNQRKVLSISPKSLIILDMEKAEIEQISNFLNDVYERICGHYTHFHYSTKPQFPICPISCVALTDWRLLDDSTKLQLR